MTRDANPKRYSVLDLFAGCGGLSRGLERTGRFSTSFGVEIEPHAAATFQANLHSSDGNPSHVYVGDVWNLANDRELLWSHLKECGFDSPGEIDLLVGGPPCQGFSRNGVRRYSDEEKRVRFYDLPVNHLFKAFLEILEEVQPKVVLIENVREFLKANNGLFLDQLVSRLSELGYAAKARKLCAADFGVPQIRHRAFVLASQHGIDVDFPHPSHFYSAERTLWSKPYTTVRDAISDLPDPSWSHADPPLLYSTAVPASEFACQLRSRSGEVHNHVARKLSAQSLARVKAVGLRRMRDIDSSLQTKKFYGSAYGRLAWDEPALTITTWVYHVGSGRFAHPSDDRAITMREAARLQSFDDDFIFPPLINPVSRMIGNAVPPLVGEAFGGVIARALDRSS